MTDHTQDPLQTDEIVLQDHVAPELESSSTSSNASAAPATVADSTVDHAKTEEINGAPADRWRTEAGRKGARRVHQLMQEGLLYEKEHGLKSGRQRLRQLIELGKIYEQEHGIQPERPKKHRERLARMEREELLATLLNCLLRIAKPSFRAELERLVAALRPAEAGHAA
jgi:hypothetical protein